MPAISTLSAIVPSASSYNVAYLAVGKLAKYGGICHQYSMRNAITGVAFYLSWPADLWLKYSATSL